LLLDQSVRLLSAARIARSFSGLHARRSGFPFSCYRLKSARQGRAFAAQDFCSRHRSLQQGSCFQLIFSGATFDAGLSLAADRLILLITLSLCVQGCLFAAAIRTDFCFVLVLCPAERARFPSFSHLESSSALLFPREICALSCF
jgi:hypothetical protein